MYPFCLQVEWGGGTWVAQVFEQLPPAQVIILESENQVLRQARCSVGNLLLALTLSGLVLCHTLSQVKYNLKKMNM